MDMQYNIVGLDNKHVNQRSIENDVDHREIKVTKIVVVCISPLEETIDDRV